MKNAIVIQDWAGNILFTGSHTDKKVDLVLEANRCKCAAECKACDGTGYSGDFEVYWKNENDTRNVYEFINY